MLVTLVTACSDRKTANAGDSSPFTGNWLGANAKRDFDEARRSPDRVQTVFCDRVRANPRVHGIFGDEAGNWDGNLLINAWTVNSGGDVFAWSPLLNQADAESRNEHYVGHVQSNGFFVKQKDADVDQTDIRTAAYNDQRSDLETARVQRAGDDSLRVYHTSETSGGPSTVRMDRVSDEYLRDYTDAVDTCGHRLWKVVAPTQPRLPQRYDPRTQPAPEVRRDGGRLSGSSYDPQDDEDLPTLRDGR
jgi:hypothetical protein